MMSKQIRFFVLLLMGLLVFQLVACSSSNDKGAAELEVEQTLQAIYAEDTAQALGSANLAEAQTPAEAPTVPPPVQAEVPFLMPGDPPDPERTLKDFDSSLRATEKRTISGDRFLDNRFERPFTSQEMVYQPDLDIITVDFAQDEDFFYFTINLFGMNADEWGLNGLYGIEFDRKLNGRGDLLVWSENIQADWSMENVYIYKDQNGDVGGPQPIVADPGFNGSGYDAAVEMSGDDVAYARISPDDPEAVQIAVSRVLLDDPAEFLWGAWADNGLRDVTGFDYNDTMGPSKAGSPINTDADYPVGALFNLDNTCRLPFGFEQMGASYPGMCITMPPAPEPVKKGESAPNCHMVCPPCGLMCPPCYQVCN